MTSVVEFKGRLVAAGAVTSVEHQVFPLTGALWTSTDGRRWQRVQPSPFGDAFTVRLDATRSTLYAISGGKQGDSPEPSRVWRSTDGHTWRLLTANAPSGLGEYVAARRGLVAVGSDLVANCGSGIQCVRTAIWTSRDGITWTRATRDATVQAAGFATGVVSTRDGLVAIGEELRQLPGTTPRVWTSRTGTRWDSRPSPALTRAQANAYGIAAGGRQALLLGTVPARSVLVPTTTTTSPPQISADGKSTSVRICGTLGGDPAVWTRTGTADWTRGGVAGMGPVAATMMVFSHGAWVGAAVEGDCSSSRTVFVTSSDARRWHRRVAGSASVTASPTFQSPTALASTPSGAVAFVSAFPDPTGRPEVWTWTARG